jgi:hypothetical protein
VLENVPTIETKAWHATHRELDGQDVAFLASWKV